MLRELWYRLRSVIGRARMDREMAEEMRDHVEREAARNVARGMDAAEARRRALISFGGMERFGAAARDELRSRPVEDFVDDVRYALRSLARSPLFAAVAVLSLGLGVGANTAIFSVVDGVLLKALPFPEADRLVLLGVEFHGQNVGTSASSADLQALVAARSFESVGAHYRSRSGVTWTGAGEAEIVPCTWVTPGLIAALGVAPDLGRAPRPEEGAAGSPRVVMLSHEFWRDRFGGARDAIGRTMMLDGDAYTIVGVMPPDFRLPGLPADALWPVLQMEAAESRSPFWLTLIARVSEGVSDAQRTGELALIRDEVNARFPDATANWSYSATPLRDVLVSGTRATILVLFGAVALVLVIAAANVANLLLARATARAPELAVRSALGAGRGRLVRQLVAEGLVVAGLGAAIGVALAYGGLDLLASLTPRDLPRFHEIRLDGRVLLFTASIALLTGVLVGVVPALRIPRGGLREAGRGGAAGRERVTMRSALVVAEFALALTVLIGAALLGNSLIRLQRVDPGAATSGVLAVRLGLPQTGYDEAAVGQFFDALLADVRAMPGVQAAAVSMAVPPNRLVMRNPFTPEGRVFGPGDVPPVAHQLLVTPDYFRAIGAPLLRGRDFSIADNGDAPRVAIIDETMARRYFGDRDPIGRTIQLGEPDPGSARITIVGVAPNVRYAGLELEREPTVYVPYAQGLWWRTMYLVVRTAADPHALLPAIRARVAALDPQVPVREVRTMEDLMREAVAEPRFRTLLLGGFAGLALLLAAAGIYGVMSYSVQQRRREMSIRLALGARRHEIIGLVVRRGLLLAVAGAVLGIAMAAALSGLLRSILFGVQALDPVTFAAAAAFLLAVALMASLLPGIRASRAQPAATLRAE